MMKKYKVTISSWCIFPFVNECSMKQLYAIRSLMQPITVKKNADGAEVIVSHGEERLDYIDKNDVSHFVLH